MSDKAPVALMAYKRVKHLANTLSSLEACSGFADTRVVVFSDGPRDAASAQEVAAVRAMLWARKTANMEIVEAPSNKGLARSIIGAVAQLTEAHGRVIVIEDDLILHPSALDWFNRALDRFADDPQVFHVTAYQFPTPAFRERKEGMLLPFISSWGWATWGRAWTAFDPAATGWEDLVSDAARRRAFNLDDSFPLAEYLTAQMQGRHDSWASRWAWSVFKAGGQAVFPPTSLVRNMGFDETATHNGLGIFRRLVHMPEPILWRGAEAPDLPRGPAAAADLRAFKTGLRSTGAMARARIKAFLRRLRGA